MNNDLNKINHFLGTIVKNKELKKLFVKSTYEMIKLEKVFIKDFSKYKSSENFKVNSTLSNIEEYFNNNIYSIFFISLFDVLGIDEIRIKKYLKIINTLRGIICSSDNFINEKSNLFAFDFNDQSNIVLKSLFYIVNSQMIINENLRELSLGSESLSHIEVEILNSIYSIIYAKYLREHFNEKNYPAPDYIIEKIHENTGGKVFEISFLPVLVNEVDSPRKLNNILKGLREIGTALKILDDINRSSLDLRHGRLNIFHSSIVYYEFDSKISYIDLKKNFENSNVNIVKTYNKTLKYLINISIEKITDGFSILSENSYPVKSEDIFSLIKYLFKIKGLESEWLFAEQSK